MQDLPGQQFIGQDQISDRVLLGLKVKNGQLSLRRARLFFRTAVDADKFQQGRAGIFIVAWETAPYPGSGS